MAPDALAIADVERETGLSKDTLRVWERRYGFPSPLRDACDERLYPPEQVERLRLLARLVGGGQRPNRVVHLPLHELKALAQRPAIAETTPVITPELQALLAILQQHDAGELRRALHGALLRQGLALFVTQTVAPMNVLVGEAWTRGELQVFEEHIYTESVIAVLRAALGGLGIPPQGRRPRVLLTTLPQEPHALGLLMAEVMLTLKNCDCTSLGTQTPLDEIVRAAPANDADVVGLSVSPAFNTQLLLRNVRVLRQRLPPSIALWVGGSHPASKRLALDGVSRVESLTDIAALLTPWQNHPV